MTLDEFCDIYAVAQRDRLAARKYFGAQQISDASEDEWISRFEGHFTLGRAGKPGLKEYLTKSLQELQEIARQAQYPESEWGQLENKAKMAKYLSNK